MLKIRGGPLDGRTISVDPGSVLVVGRGSANEVTVMDPAMSREHFRIESDDSQMTIRDLNSLNGTTINGREIDKTVGISDGDRIDAGCTTFLVHLGEPTSLDLGLD